MIMLILAIVGQGCDVATTAWFLSLGYTELNPLVGPSPSVWFLVLLKTLVICAIIFLCRGRSRDGLLCWASLLGFGVAGWKLYVIQAGV